MNYEFAFRVKAMIPFGCAKDAFPWYGKMRQRHVPPTGSSDPLWSGDGCHGPRAAALPVQMASALLLFLLLLLLLLLLLAAAAATQPETAASSSPIHSFRLSLPSDGRPGQAGAPSPPSALPHSERRFDKRNPL
jgi:hypothetical protein